MNDHPVIARIRLNPYSRDVQRDLRDPTQMHRTVMRMVPDNLGDSPRHRSGLLYRVDETETSTTLLVQAAGLDPSRLPVGYGQADVKSLTPMFTALRKGLGVRYRIVLNPAKRERLSLEEKGKRGKIIPLSGPDADQWWLRRAAEAGLDLHVLTPTPMDPIRPRGRNTPRMRLSLIRYDGTAVVTDPDALRDALTAGIGRGKPYGAGLLSLAPARNT
ncbi:MULTISPECIES: type I-E CRISPR-associated protein Cas6/Cse3/CasE [Streptomyces]|jgi:CRISPR system Cascade subunit CasE|uniref:Type I-E CRISPR-associated protein Cas6/Cse3/CasE n=1 Tax=Streptomyces thermoviolaceus subsp. thermoviolaceus TaxID=66860 RepID=A0ABX0YWF7_STRTL|nr:MULTISPECIES: type I-E CRISPR-associated protein Cas6/Cse3/CasE [Streptomyces]WTD50635.1 type I-E CRISPR-associated protein Cas6/Cse3/CasE [Streptomyces thermoviolaceus]NJP15365.1 type I-E CRISPR-associated protein Cas6/Cse3/CasE [Streptomyces thermoviolaceus subsp. thermoviolaceus]RSR98331.1 type I-E CRISPR-associated protein Cas6/Cse3/CasE [Streptomyces sp. WAC00469]GGV76210.1 type I-E CRISPR-associated protein Cas6/Cse3/CasE [Streptomyces thermoviolaceus subsp. apingens]GHB11719.1 type I